MPNLKFLAYLSWDMERSQYFKCGSRDLVTTPIWCIFAFFDNPPVLNLSVKFDANIFIDDWYMAILRLYQFGCKMPIPTHFGEVFWGLTPNVVGHCWEPQKAHPWLEARVLAHRSSRWVKKCDLYVWRRKQKQKEKSHICTDHPRCATLPKLSCGVGSWT